MKNPNKAQIRQCQKPRLGYISAQMDADRRMAAGQKQVFCLTCERWQWPDHLCPLARTETDDEITARVESWLIAEKAKCAS